MRNEATHLREPAAGVSTPRPRPHGFSTLSFASLSTTSLPLACVLVHLRLRLTRCRRITSSMVPPPSAPAPTAAARRARLSRRTPPATAFMIATLPVRFLFLGPARVRIGAYHSMKDSNYSSSVRNCQISNDRSWRPLPFSVSSGDTFHATQTTRFGSRNGTLTST